MPKDEFDFDDPMELNGVALLTNEDTTDEMCECFIDEFLWLGHNHKQILALFRNPHYVGPNLVLQKRGEPFVREQIAAIFARWGKTVTWPAGTVTEVPPAPPEPEAQPIQFRTPTPPSASVSVAEQPGTVAPSLTDPMGSPIPNLNV